MVKKEKAYSGGDDALEETVEPESAEEFSDEIEDTGEKKCYTSNDLDQGFCEGVD